MSRCQRSRTSQRASWRDQPPFVAEDVTGYEPVVEDTVAVLFERLYASAPAKAGGKKAATAAAGTP